MTEPAHTDQLVRFLQEAQSAAGSTAALADLIGARTGNRPSEKTIWGWLRGERQPRVATLFAIVAGLHDRGISLDQAALGAGADQRPFREQVLELQRVVAQLQAALDAHLASHGQGPVDYALDAD